MHTELKLSGLAKYAWFVLAYNIVVIIWGVFLRASKSGDGCGQHWLTCHGEVIPSAPELKTIIEFSHRVTSGLDGIIVLALVVWAFLAWRRHKFKQTKIVFTAAAVSLFFVITEALVGAGLVLTGNTAETLTAARPFWAAGHLINTFILLAALSLTAWFASGGKPFDFKVSPKILFFLALAITGILFVGLSGSVAALSSMLFPSQTLTEGIAKDFSATSNILLRLRISHPILSVAVGVYLIFLASWIKNKFAGFSTIVRWANVLSLLILVQFISGVVTLLTLAPIVMQIIHLFLADAVWISFVLMSASVLAEKSEIENVSFTGQA
jgi:heme A synthase